MPERPIRSTSDALAASGDEAGEALGEVKEELHASLDRIAQLAGPAASSMGMRNLTAELQDIGAAMTRALDDAQGQVAQAFTTEADALESLLRDAISPSSGHEHGAHAALDPMDMDLAAWRELADVGPTEEIIVDSPLQDPLLPASESAGEIFVQSNDPQGHADQDPSTNPNSTSTDGPGSADQNRAAKRSSSERAAHLRAYLLDKGQEIGEMVHDVIIEPDYQPLQPPRGTEVNDPVTAVAITIVAFWEIAVNRTRRRESPSDSRRRD